MPAKRIGWEIFLGVSNTTITNGMYADEFAPKNPYGGDGTMVPDIDVYVPELTPNADGKEADAKKVYDIALANPFTDQIEQRQITFTNVIRCKYMGGSNKYIPCIHKGEQVWVLRHEGGEFSYYWLPVGRDEGLRNHEHIRWFAHNIPKCVSDDGVVSIVNDDNTYFVDINTSKRDTTKAGHTGKLIQIHTSTNDGEEYGYDIRIYPERSILEICDTADQNEVGSGNRIELNSPEKRWTIRNIDDSFIKIDKEDIFISCKGNINITAGKGIRVRGGWYDDYTLGSETVRDGTSGTIDVRTGHHTEAEQTKRETIAVSKTEKIGAKHVTTTTTHVGNVTVNGHETITAGASITGDARIDGKTFDTHIHGNGNMGSPTTPPIV